MSKEKKITTTVADDKSSIEEQKIVVESDDNINNNNNINRLEEKIIKIEKIVSSISPKDYSAEIKNFNNVNQIQDNQIKKNASKIDEISITNNNLQSLINEIERDSSNNLSTQVQNIDASKINSIYSLLYLMNIKNDLQFSNPDLNEFNDIKSYLRSLTVPENVEIALNKLDQLSILELKSHNKIIDEIHNIELKINNNLFLSFEPGLHANKKNIVFNERKDFTNYGDTLWVVKANNCLLYTSPSPRDS